MRKTTTAFAFALTLMVTTFNTTFAAPITCPPPQVAEKTDNGWACVNNGGNTSGAAETKNPND